MIINCVHTLQRLRFWTNLLTQSTSSKTNNTEITANIRTDLVQKLQKMNIRTQKSILMEQMIQEDQNNETTDEEKRKKKNKHIFRQLTTAQKMELGLLIPHSPFHLRMTKKLQGEYRKALCEDLYKMQKENLITSVRILQLQNTSPNIDEYINCAYKDVFARYMLARGVGIQWDSNNSRFGVLNQPTKSETQVKTEIVEFYRWVAELISQYRLQQKQVLGLYSYSLKKFVPIANVDVQNVYRIGYFFTMPITKFGKYSQNFQILQSRNQRISLLVMCEDPIKLLNIEAICIESNKKMIILSKYSEIKHNESQQSAMQNQYLITSMDVYTDHRLYFDKNGYVKHSIFDSHHLLEMEVCDGVKIYDEIEGYSRKGGAYVVDSFSGLPDFQRAQILQLKAKNNYIDQSGKINFPPSNQQIQFLYITDPKYQQKFLQNYAYREGINKLDLYSSYQDQIYSLNDQKLHFKKASKLVLPIPDSYRDQLMQAIQKSILQQSKVQIPKLKRTYPKPRDKRRHKKEIRQLSKQQTEYMSLKDSLQAFEELPFSQIDTFGSQLTMPLIFETSNEDQTSKIVMNGRIREVMISSLDVVMSQGQNSVFGQQMPSAKWDYAKIQKHLELLRKQSKNEDKSKIEIKEVVLPKQLLNGYRCFKNYNSKPHLSSIVIEPQSKTEDIVPYFFYLHMFLKKMISKRNPNPQRGRRTSHNRAMKKIDNKMFSLIKFHPTIDQSQRNRRIEEVLFGVVKANNEQQYGYGLEALRLWVARKDSYLGDRKISDKQINKQLQLSAFIRKLYWQILPLMNINLDKIVVQNNEQEIQLHSDSSIVPRQKLSYLHNFMLDHIRFYTLNMEECYTKLDLSRALQLTEDFFKNYIDQIFVKVVRKRIIAYPLSSETKQHIYVLKKIIDLLAVVAPLLPYSAYHISKSQLIAWPEWQLQDIRPQLIPNYNRMTKLRVEVRNKFLLNDFKHSELVIPLDMVKQEQQDVLTEIWKLSKNDLQLFFGIENISLGEPKQIGKSFKLKLTQNHPVGQVPKLKFYEYKQVCMRCSPNHHYGTHICQKCLDYLNNNFGRRLPLN